MRRWIVLWAACSLAVPSAPARAGAPSWQQAVRELLARRAEALVAGDRPAFEQTMADAPAAFRAREIRRFVRLRALEIAGYSLEPDLDGYEDLAGSLRARPRADEVHVVQASERLAFREFDEEPSLGTFFLTVARTGDRWSVVADDGLEDLGLLSARDLWDFGSVQTLARGSIVVLHHGQAPYARALLDAARLAIASVRRSWPYRFPARAVVEIPRTTAELSRIFGVTYDLGPFVAFQTSSVDREDGTFRFTGNRIFAQPANFFARSAPARRSILAHEVLHLATRPLSGMFVPAWMDEGVAQVYGEGTRPRVRRIVQRRLPDEWMFSVGSPAEIQFAYEAGGSFVSWLAARSGRTVPARLYGALGAETPLSFGTARYHLDHAARAVLGSSFASLERAWLRSIGVR